MVVVYGEASSDMIHNLCNTDLLVIFSMELATTSPARFTALHRYTPVSVLVAFVIIKTEPLTNTRPSASMLLSCRLQVTSGSGTPLTWHSMDTLVPLRIDNACPIRIETGSRLSRDRTATRDTFICGALGTTAAENFRLNLMFNVYRKLHSSKQQEQRKYSVSIKLWRKLDLGFVRL